MSTDKQWPDPKCSGPHVIGIPIIKWQHTFSCKKAYWSLVARQQRERETESKDPDVVDRGRKAGAI